MIETPRLKNVVIFIQTVLSFVLSRIINVFIFIFLFIFINIFILIYLYMYFVFEIQEFQNICVLNLSKVSEYEKFLKIPEFKNLLLASQIYTILAIIFSFFNSIS